VNGLGFSALLIGMLRRPKVPGLDEDLARRDSALLRLALLLGLELALLIWLTVTVR
jgi:hypothetical protein